MYSATFFKFSKHVAQLAITGTVTHSRSIDNCSVLPVTVDGVKFTFYTIRKLECCVIALPSDRK